MIHLVTEDNFSRISARLEHAYRRRRSCARGDLLGAFREVVAFEMAIFTEFRRVCDHVGFGVAELSRSQRRRPTPPRHSRAAPIAAGVSGAESASPVSHRDAPNLRRRARAASTRRVPTRGVSGLARRIRSDMASGGFGAVRAPTSPNTVARPRRRNARR